MFLQMALFLLELLCLRLQITTLLLVWRAMRVQYQYMEPTSEIVMSLLNTEQILLPEHLLLST